MAMVEGSRGTRRIANRGSAGRGRAAVGQENRAGQRRTKRALVRQEHRLLCLAPAATDGQGRSYADTTLVLWPLVRQDRHSELAAYRGQRRTKWRRRLSRRLAEVARENGGNHPCSVAVSRWSVVKSDWCAVKPGRVVGSGQAGPLLKKVGG